MAKTDESPIFFYMEREKDFGFMSNFHYESFTAPNPALWIFKDANAPTTSSTATETEEQRATIEFRHSEQYFMYCKAIYFGDRDTAWMILQTKSPMECKSLGRAVKDFSQEEWEKDDINVRVMEEALWWKFGGGHLSDLLQLGGPSKDSLITAAKEKRMEAIGDLGRRLLATGERQLIEASSRDRYWGIGYSVKQGPHFYKKNWGRNQLGKSLMAVRQRLRVLVERPGPKLEA